MVRAALIHGHHVMRAGVEAILARTTGVLVVAGTSGGLHEVEHMLSAPRPTS